MNQLPSNRGPEPPKPADDRDRGVTKYYNVDCKVAALLCYMPVMLLNIAVAGFWLNTEPRGNRFLRFHSYQSLLLTVGFLAVLAILWLLENLLNLIPFLSFFDFFGKVFVYLFFAAYMLLNFYLAWSALQGEMMLLPYIGDYADQNSM